MGQAGGWTNRQGREEDGWSEVRSKAVFSQELDRTAHTKCLNTVHHKSLLHIVV
jgi:hypothetical protein